MPKVVYTNNDITKVFYSGYTIEKIYACDGELVYSASTEPPVVSNKLTYTISGNTYTIPCNGNSTLTRLEVQQSIYDNVGSLAKLESAVIGDCVTVVGSNCFNEETSLTSVTIPSSVVTLKDSAFYRCEALSSITIPDSVTTIENNAFDATSISAITFPSGITELSVEVCNNCIYLNTIDIPSGVTNIDRYAFHFEAYAQEPRKTIAENLARNRSVTIHATVPPTLSTYGPFSWSGDPENCTYPIYVPAGSLEAYKTAWPYYADRLQAIQ